VNGKKHSGMLSKANWWTGIKGWKMEVTSSVRPYLSRNNDRRRQNLYFYEVIWLYFFPSPVLF
jgi:hypothetical protein